MLPLPRLLPCMRHIHRSAQIIRAYIMKNGVMMGHFETVIPSTSLCI